MHREIVMMGFWKTSRNVISLHLEDRIERDEAIPEIESIGLTL